MMSAFLCEKETFDTIASAVYFLREGRDHLHSTRHAIQREYRDVFTADELSSDAAWEAILVYKLHGLNNMALNARYRNAPQWDYGYEFTMTIPSANPIKLYKAIGCLLYQCSEGDVPETRLYKFLDHMHDALAHDIARDTEAYREAGWG